MTQRTTENNPNGSRFVNCYEVASGLNLKPEA
jgi:hypothetical protein